MADERTDEGKKRWRRVVFVIGGAVLLFAGFQTYTHLALKPDPVEDIFSLIERQGYTPSVGFAGTFEPGNIIQVAQRAVDGAQLALDPPLVFMWSSDCFPKVEARDTTFVLPEVSGTSSAAMTAGMEAIAQYAPTLEMRSTAIADYHLEFDNVRVRTVARGEISGQLSARCVEALNREVGSGDEVDWYAVIVESVVADGLSLEVNWKDAVDAGVRNEAIDTASATFENAMAAVDGEGGVSLNLQVTQNDSEKTVMSASRPIIIGYRARPLQPME